MAACNARLDWRFGTQFSISASEATATWRFTNFVLYCIVLYYFHFDFETFFCFISLNFDARQGWRELLTLFLLLYVYGGDDNT